MKQFKIWTRQPGKHLWLTTPNEYTTEEVKLMISAEPNEEVTRNGNTWIALEVGKDANIDIP